MLAAALICVLLAVATAQTPTELAATTAGGAADVPVATGAPVALPTDLTPEDYMTVNFPPPTKGMRRANRTAVAAALPATTDPTVHGRRLKQSSCCICSLVAEKVWSRCNAGVPCTGAGNDNGAICSSDTTLLNATDGKPVGQGIPCLWPRRLKNENVLTGTQAWYNHYACSMDKPFIFRYTCPSSGWLGYQASQYTNRQLGLEFAVGIPREGSVPCYSDKAACIKTNMIGDSTTGGTCRASADITSGFYQYYVYLSTSCSPATAGQKIGVYESGGVIAQPSRAWLTKYPGVAFSPGINYPVSSCAALNTPFVQCSSYSVCQ